MNFEIKIEELLKGPLINPTFFGEQVRIPSHTDVAFLSKDRLIIAHRFSGKFFLVQVKGESFEILDSYKIIYKGKYEFPDLIHAYKNRIYIVNLNNILHILEVTNDKLQYVKSFPVHASYGYHGLHAFASKVFLVSTTKLKENPFVVTEYNVDSSKCLHYHIIGNTNRMKDISFLTDTVCVILTSYNDRDIGLGKEKEVYDGEILLCEFNNKEFIVIDRVEKSPCHFDSVVSKDGKIYCTAVEPSGSYILTADIVHNKITNLQNHPCAPFPHGIDIYENYLAYSSYGTSTTYIKQLPLSQ
jgi:hypothetical protein